MAGSTEIKKVGEIPAVKSISDVVSVAPAETYAASFTLFARPLFEHVVNLLRRSTELLRSLFRDIEFSPNFSVGKALTL